MIYMIYATAWLYMIHATACMYVPSVEGRHRYRPTRVVWVIWNGRVGPDGEAEGSMGPLDCMQSNTVEVLLAV
jgi:hypothetical protein